MFSCDLINICLAENCCVGETDWTIGRLVVIHRMDDIYTTLKTDKKRNMSNSEDVRVVGNNFNLCNWKI